MHGFRFLRFWGRCFPAVAGALELAGCGSYAPEHTAIDQAEITSGTLTNPILNIPGQSSPFFPPDTVGAVGARHYVQMVNATTFQIFDKNLNPLSPPTSFGGLYSSGNCTANAGDPIVVYDHLADRWLLSQFAFPHQMCIALSRTGTPTTNPADWFLYEIDTLVFPDYPKIGVWPDGYYMTAYEGANLGVFVFDRNNMLAGNGGVSTFACAAAGSQCLTTSIPSLGTPTARDTRILPGDLVGPAPPAGTPNVFVRTVDDHQDPNGGPDRVEVYSASVNFTSKTLNFSLAVTLAPNPFDILLCNRNGNGFRDCIPQPGDVDTIDSLSNRPMMQLEYRNFGSFASLLFNQTVNEAALFPGIATHELAGIRWYELRNTGAGWTIQQQGDYSPQPNPTSDNALVHRWMGSAAMNRDGDVAVGYSADNSDNTPGQQLFPSIRYTGRQAEDPAGTLQASEITVFTGAGPEGDGDAFSNPQRWGDYSAMTVDPVDDCTFYYTTQLPLSGGTHPTRIATFRYTDCGLPNICVHASQTATLSDRTQIVAPTTAGQFLQLGADGTITGNTLVNGNALLRDRARINGNLTLAGTLTRQNNVVISGTLTQNATVALPSLIATTFPFGSTTLQIPPNSVITLPAGTYGNVDIGSRSRVTLNPGTYNFASLTVEPDTTITANAGGAVQINVQNAVTFGDRTALSAATPGAVTVYTNGSSFTVGTQVVMSALLIGPNASIHVFSRTVINGCVGGLNVTIESDTTVNSGGLTLPATG